MERAFELEQSPSFGDPHGERGGGPPAAQRLARASERLRCALAPEPPPLAGAPLEAAVLLCLHRGSVLLIRRRLRDGDRWSGHVALPGGRYAPADGTLLDTALRETREELGFALERYGEVLGSAGALNGRSLGVRVGVFVAELRRRPPLVLSDEVAAAHWVPWEALAPGTARVPELPDPVPCYRVEVDGSALIVWGLTYRILERVRRLV